MQFFEQPQSVIDKCTTEEEFLQRTYISMQDVTTEPWSGNKTKKFKFFRLDDCKKPIYDSTDLKI